MVLLVVRNQELDLEVVLQFMTKRGELPAKLVINTDLCCMR